MLWREWPSGYFSTSHNTSLFLSTHRGHIPLSPSPSLWRSFHPSLRPRRCHIITWRCKQPKNYLFQTDFSHTHTHTHTHTLPAHTHSGTYITCLLSWDESFSRSMNLTTYIFALKWFLNVLLLIPILLYHCLYLEILVCLSLYVCTSLSLLSPGCLTIFGFHLFLCPSFSDSLSWSDGWLTEVRTPLMSSVSVLRCQKALYISSLHNAYLAYFLISHTPSHFFSSVNLFTGCKA